MTVGPGDFVKVKYHGRDRLLTDPDGTRRVEHDTTNPLRLMWDSRPYIIEVDGEGFVPFEAASNAFGDPRSAENMGNWRDPAGNVGFVLDRATEVRRLRTLYDNQLGNENEILYAPQVEVADLEGNSIRTVLDDPMGESVIPVTTTALDQASLLAQLQRQQRLIELLAQQQGIDLNNPNLVAQEPAATPDDQVDPDGFIPEPEPEVVDPETIPIDGGGS